MLIDKNNFLTKKLDFRGTKVHFLDTLTARELLEIMAAAEMAVNMKDMFQAKDLAPQDWTKKGVFKPIYDACGQNEAEANRLFGVIIKQALIMSPLLFAQVSGEWEASWYKRESLEY
ncbi:MAG: hypothetical protein FWE22_07930 [Firmicutes bacterium]|nr:hypothetical protein [Bacillota bacterium]